MHPLDQSFVEKLYLVTDVQPEANSWKLQLKSLPKDIQRKINDELTVNPRKAHIMLAQALIEKQARASLQNEWHAIQITQKQHCIQFTMGSSLLLGGAAVYGAYTTFGPVGIIAGLFITAVGTHVSTTFGARCIQRLLGLDQPTPTLTQDMITQRSKLFLTALKAHKQSISS